MRNFNRTIKRHKKPNRTVIKNRRKFLRWFKKASPNAYAEVMRSAGLSVMSADADPVKNESIWESIVSGAKEILPTIVQARAQQQIFDAQLKRARQGLPPLSTAQYAPTIRVQAGVSPGIQKFAIPALIGFGLLGTFFFLRKKK